MDFNLSSYIHNLSRSNLRSSMDYIFINKTNDYNIKENYQNFFNNKDHFKDHFKDEFKDDNKINNNDKSDDKNLMHTIISTGRRFTTTTSTPITDLICQKLTYDFYNKNVEELDELRNKVDEEERAYNQVQKVIYLTPTFDIKFEAARILIDKQVCFILNPLYLVTPIITSEQEEVNGHKLYNLNVDLDNKNIDDESVDYKSSSNKSVDYKSSDYKSSSNKIVDYECKDKVVNHKCKDKVDECKSNNDKQDLMTYTIFKHFYSLLLTEKEWSFDEFHENLDNITYSDWQKQDDEKCIDEFNLLFKTNCEQLWLLPYSCESLLEAFKIAYGNQMEIVRYSNYLCYWANKKYSAMMSAKQMLDNLILIYLPRDCHSIVMHYFHIVN